MAINIEHVIPEGNKYKSFDEWFNDFKIEMIKIIDLHNRDFSFQKDPDLKLKLKNKFKKIIEDHKYHYGVNLQSIDNISIKFMVDLF